VTAPAERIEARARTAQAAGAGGLLFCPGLAGLDAMRRLAADAALGLPILSHPALIGGLGVGADHGIAPGLLYGTLPRLARADATICPSFGGRFSLSLAQCRAIAAAATRPRGVLKPIWPVPAGGMTLDRVPELRAVYGPDCILLIGGDLHAGDDLIGRCRAFRRLVEPA
jgi:ribulose-bisphosphate carboxylase large chain